MSIAPRLRALLLEVEAVEATAASQHIMLDHTFDLHNDLMDWATNTSHGTAAIEVMAILDRYVTPPKVKAPADLSEVLSPETTG